MYLRGFEMLEARETGARGWDSLDGLLTKPALCPLTPPEYLSQREFLAVFSLSGPLNPLTYGPPSSLAE